jgi:hypothetical protein
MNPLQTGMFPQSQMDRTQFATPTQMPVSREIVSSDFDTQIDPYSGNLPRFKDGGNVGIKSIAKDLPKYGRYNDDMVAHISSDEARMLKAMGGAGTINPITGLPEYGLGKLNPFKSGSIYEKAGQGISKGLAGLDKAVGNAIPGGWGTVANIAGAAVGLPTPMLVGMGAATGSGVLKPGGKFNLQGAIMGGAMAYGGAKLGEGLRAAGGMSSGPQALGDLGGAGFAPAVIEPAVGVAPQALGNMGGAGFTSATPSTFSNIVNNAGPNLAATGQGIKNLSGFGAQGLEGIKPAAAAFGSSGASMQNTALPIMAGTSGLAAIDEQNQAIKDNEAANAAAQNQYNAEMAAITQGANRSEDIMRRNPYQFAGGGAIAFAPGGNVPRFLSGGGDGLSDDIPATIDGKQPARLADGEFVISSDVVSALGGGSSKAGAKKLYAMMDRIREQAHGTEKQVRRVNEKKVLPA